MPHLFNPIILREYDLRGTVGKELTTMDAEMLGRAFGTTVARAGGKHVMVGYDGRTHSPSLEAAAVTGLVATGMKVTRIGRGPTPMLNFALHHANASAGLMVTGSHNPADQNGFKLIIAKHLKGGGPVYGDGIKKLAELAAKGDFVTGAGSETSSDVREMYVQRLLRDLDCPFPLKVVWDIGNGAAGEIAMRLKGKLPGQHTMLFADIDGRFPHHHADPTVATNLEDLIKEVRAQKADLGIAFDGDGDRLAAVDGMGRIMAGDQLMCLFAEDVLKTFKGATIIGDVKASNVLFERIAALGGKPLMWKTGYSLIKIKMMEIKAPLAGEMSGHIFFADKYYGFDDGIYAALRLLNIISKSRKSLAQWRDGLPQTVTTPDLRFPVDETRKFKIIDDIKKRLKTAKIKFDDLDGVRVTTPDGWWLLRASNTQSLVTARAEAKDTTALLRLKTQMAQELEASGLFVTVM